MNTAAERWSSPIRASLVAAANRPRSGVAWAAITVLIWAGYPVVTRLSVTTTLQPEDLFALRFGVSAALFAPYLARHAAVLQRDVWSKGVGLAACQGTLAAFFIIGLQFAPASHASALVQGVIPAWLLVLGAVLYGSRMHNNASGVVLIVLGAALLVADSSIAFSRQTLFGDLLFLLAALLAAGYIAQMHHFRIPPTAGAALVAIYSALVFLPWYALFGSGAFADASWSELALQTVYQGVLVGYVSFITLNRAIAALGGTRTSALISLVPVLTALIAIPVLGERPSILDCLAIVLVTAGVAFVSRTPTTTVRTTSVLR
jgi:drug/metabolite transporter (DMT)-like permease